MTPLDASYAECELLTRRTAGNFHWAFLTLPRTQYRAMCALYAFMRVSDDIADDERKPVEQRRTELHAWRTELQASLAGDATESPYLLALANTVKEFAIPQRFLEELLEGMASDLQAQTFATFADLEQYCYRVAGTVGLCCIHIWGFHGEQAIPQAIACGTAFQLTNILRDVQEDFRAGRTYFPQEDWSRFELSCAELVSREKPINSRQFLEFQANRAENFYREAHELRHHLSPVGQRILAAMLGIYGGLLQEIRRRDYDILSQRVALPRWKKLWIVCRSSFFRPFAKHAAGRQSHFKSETG